MSLQKNYKRAMLGVSILTLVLALTAMLTMSMFGTSSVASASELDQSSSVVTQYVDTFSRVDATNVELDINVSVEEYKQQLLDAGIDPDINPVDYGMPQGARLATRMTHTYDMYNDWVWSDQNVTLWSKITVYVTTSSWQHGFLWLQTSSDTKTTIIQVKFGIDGNNSNIEVSHTKIYTKRSAGSYHGDYVDTPDYKNNNFDQLDETTDIYKRNEGGGYGHSANIKWEVSLYNKANNITWSPDNVEKTIFTE